MAFRGYDESKAILALRELVEHVAETFVPTAQMQPVFLDLPREGMKLMPVRVERPVRDRFDS